jgi:predicted TIM-barrel fold metal-dependent hydrolase
MRTAPHRIDVHYHIIPEPYVQALAARGIHGSTAVKFPRWTVGRALKDMDRNGVATAVTSLSSPGVQFGDLAFGRELARMCNELQAQMAADHPGRFGSFAFLPLPDVEGALAELAYALDELGHDGVVLLTDTAGRYLGDPAYEELFAELDRRGAVVFVHPHTEPERERRYELFHPLLEWPVHTTRAAIDLLISGRLARYPRIRYILAHGGGTVPYLAHRIATGAAAVATPALGDLGPDEVDPGRTAEALTLLRAQYYDTAAPGEAHLAALQAFAGAGHVVFGTDGGWSSAVQTGLSVRTLMDYDGFDAGHRAAIDRDTAAALFPRFSETR